MSDERHSGLGQQLPHADSDGDLLKRRQLLRRARIGVVVVLVLLGAGAARTIVSRMANANTLESVAATANKTYVRTTTPKAAGGGGQALVLPGTLQGYTQSPVAARASGYLKRWTTDIGSRVQKGDLLAEIETPEIDQQLSQAVAARAQTSASLGLARSTMERWEALRKKDAVSQQDLDERRSAYTQAQANLASVDANIERLRQLGAFKRVTAPFAGVITRRNVDVGDLIDAGGGSGRALFVLTQTDPLRIYVNVPQSYAQVVKAGQTVQISQPELAGRSFEGRIARTAASIDASTRTMQVEVGLANPDNALLPGAYVLVSLPGAAGSTLTMSTNALILRSSGPQVALVDQDRRVRLKPVKIGRNFGQTVEVLEGVGPGDRLVQNPPDSLAENDQVEFAPDAPAAQNTAAAGGNRPAP